MDLFRWLARRKESVLPVICWFIGHEPFPDRDIDCTRIYYWYVYEADKWTRLSRRSRCHRWIK